MKNAPEVDVWDFWLDEENYYVIALEKRENSQTLKFLWRKINDANKKL